MRELVAVLVCLGAATVVAIPTISSMATVNFGTPIVVSYDITDGLDGRLTEVHGNSATDRDLDANDWIGLFPKGECVNPSNNQDKHKCHVHWEYIPAYAKTGSVTFQAEHYKSAGEYEARYFYGDDPTISGNYEWVGQGFVCNSYVDTTSDGTRNDFDYRTGLESTPGLTSVWQSATMATGVRVTTDLDGTPTTPGFPSTATGTEAAAEQSSQTYWTNQKTNEVLYTEPSPMKMMGLTIAHCQCDSTAATEIVATGTVAGTVDPLARIALAYVDGAVVSDTAVTLTATNADIQVGQIVTGTGVTFHTSPGGTIESHPQGGLIGAPVTVVSISGVNLVLSSTQTINSGVKLYFADPTDANLAATNTWRQVTLSAENNGIRSGQIVTGAGITGTVTVASVNGVNLVLSSAHEIANGATLSFSITQETCLKYRAACSRCTLDAAAFSNTITVVGAGGVDTYQDMSSIPGFEIGF